MRRRSPASESQRGTALLSTPGPVRAETAPGDHQHAAAVALIRGLDKIDQLAMRFGLSAAVQVEPRLDRTQTALQPLGVGPVDAGKTLDRAP